MDHIVVNKKIKISGMAQLKTFYYLQFVQFKELFPTRREISFFTKVEKRPRITTDLNRTRMLKTGKKTQAD